VIFSEAESISDTTFNSMWAETDIEENYPFRVGTEDQKKAELKERLLSEISWKAVDGPKTMSYYGAGVTNEKLHIVSITHEKDSEGSLSYIFSDSYNEGLIDYVKSLGFNQFGMIFLDDTPAYHRYANFFNTSFLFAKFEDIESPTQSWEPDERELILSFR